MRDDASHPRRPKGAETRQGARQIERFDPSRAHVLDDEARFVYLDPQRVAELLDLFPGATVVDLGAGSGTYAIEVAERRPDVLVVALDEQPAMLARLREKPRAARANLIAASPGEWRSIGRAADRVLAINVLHELEDGALDSIAMLLADGGFALFIDWNAAAKRPVGPPAGHVYTPRDARERLERHEFLVSEIEGFAFHHAFIARPILRREGSTDLRAGRRGDYRTRIRAVLATRKPSRS